MKKILLTTAAAVILSTSSVYAAEGAFFVKANGGWSKLSKIKGLKSKNDAYFGVGAGYYVMDNARVDLTFDHFVNPTHTQKETATQDGVKLKGTVNTLLLNGYVDLFDVDAFKVFVGAGVGAGQVKAKVTVTADGESDSYSAKQKTGLAFAGYVGGSYEFTPGVTGELAYSYRDMGKTKKSKDLDASYSYKGHHVGVGVRFDI
jgi:opacity protein-like surface antigen